MSTISRGDFSPQLHNIDTINSFIHSLSHSFIIFSHSTLLMCTYGPFLLLSENQVKSSGDKELQGAKQCFSFLKDAGLSIVTFVSDHHRSIAKWIREHQPDTSHFFYIWHIARLWGYKGVKQGGTPPLVLVCDIHKARIQWINSSQVEVTYQAHQYKHDKHPDPLYTECAHKGLARQMWIKNGMDWPI